MFTGIVQEIGVVRSIAKEGPLYRLEIGSGEISKSTKIGDSVAVNGVCLTMVKGRPGSMTFDIMAETVRKTNFSDLKKGDPVNLEGSLKAGDALGGHFVSGHIDCIGSIALIRRSGLELSMEISIPSEFAGLVVDKGSVAIDGVSLTVGKAGSDRFDIYLIPHTFEATTLGFKKAGDRVNIEFDILGKYIMRSKDAGSRITESFLKKNGF